MSVYIPGMAMPTSCSSCSMLEGGRMDGLCHAASRWLDDDEFWTWYVYPEGDVDDSKPCNCPLVPVPEHGRLIDADALISHYKGNIWTAKTDYAEGLRDVISDIKATPTIIPADPAEEGEG